MNLTIEKIVQLVYSFAIAFGQFGAVEIERLDALVREFAAGYKVSVLNIYKALHGVEPDGIPLDVAEKYACLGIFIGALVDIMTESEEVAGEREAARKLLGDVNPDTLAIIAHEKRVELEANGDAHVLHGTNDGNGVLVAESAAPEEIASEEPDAVNS